MSIAPRALKSELTLVGGFRQSYLNWAAHGQYCNLLTQQKPNTVCGMLTLQAQADISAGDLAGHTGQAQADISAGDLAGHTGQTQQNSSSKAGTVGLKTAISCQQVVQAGLSPFGVHLASCHSGWPCKSGRKTVWPGLSSAHCHPGTATHRT